VVEQVVNGPLACKQQQIGTQRLCTQKADLVHMQKLGQSCTTTDIGSCGMGAIATLSRLDTAADVSAFCIVEEASQIYVVVEGQ